MYVVDGSYVEVLFRPSIRVGAPPLVEKFLGSPRPLTSSYTDTVNLFPT